MLLSSSALSGCALLVGSVDGDRVFEEGDTGTDSGDASSEGKADRREEDGHAGSDHAALDSATGS